MAIVAEVTVTPLTLEITLTVQQELQTRLDETDRLHRRAVARVSGKAGSVPVLVLDGDGVLDDSPLIVRWADARASSERGSWRDQAWPKASL